MTNVYQLMINDKQINDLYYDEDSAIDNAQQIANDTKEMVSIYEAEEIKGTPVEFLGWLAKWFVWPQ